MSWEDSIQDDNSSWEKTIEDEGLGDFSPETALRSFGNAATLGYGDNIRAATEPAVFKILSAITGKNVESDGDYIQRRDEEIKKTKKLQEENPKSSMLGTGLGVGASALVPAATFTKGAGAAARIANTAANGAVQGVLQNPGETEGEISGYQLEDRLKNAAIGAGLGAGFQGAGELVARGAQRIAPALKSFAAEKAVKTSGAMKRDFDHLSRKQVDELGETLLEDGIVTSFATPKKIADRLSSKISDTTQDLQTQIKNADDVLWRPEGFNMENATPEQIEAFKSAFVPTSDVKDRLIGDVLKKYDGVPQKKIQPIIDEITDWFEGRPENMSIAELQKMKVSFNKFLNDSDFYKFGNGGITPMTKEGLLTVRRGVKNAIEDKGNAAAEIMGEAGGGIRQTNKKLGQYIEAQDLANDAIARNASNREISLTDYLAMVTAAQGGGVANAALGLVGNKLTRGYANPVMASNAFKLSKQAQAFNDFVQSSPKVQELFRRSPAAAAAMFQGVVARTNQKFEDNPNPYQPEIQEDRVLRTIGSDPNNLNHIQNPQLRRQVEQMQQDKFKREVSPPEAQKEFLQGN